MKWFYNVNKDIDSINKRIDKLGIEEIENGEIVVIKIDNDKSNKRQGEHL